eukprot:5490945-Ditylum_brightwellii.AAC.1
MSLHTFVDRVNKINDQLEQFSPRDGGNLQVKLLDNTLMDILETAVPKSWQGEMCRQHFVCTAKGYTNIFRFCKNLELLDPPKQAQRNRTAATSFTGSNQQNHKKKRDREANAPSLSANQAQKKVSKYCMLHGRGRHMMNKCDA